MKKYEELKVYDKIDFFTKILGYDRKRVTSFIHDVRSLFNNSNVKAQLKCEKYPTNEELLNMIFDTLIGDNLFNCSNFKEVYELIYELNLRIKKYDEEKNSFFEF